MIKSKDLNNRAVTNEETRKVKKLKTDKAMIASVEHVPSLFTKEDEKRVEERTNKEEK